MECKSRRSRIIESFSETRVDIANNTPEASPVGEVTVISKSGTNKLHGSVFDYYVTPMFRARPFWFGHLGQARRLAGWTDRHPAPIPWP
jgi:hypothetical protein